jgi:hypothetical protein
VSATPFLHPRTARSRTGGLSLVLALGVITLAGCGSSVQGSGSSPVRPPNGGASTRADPASTPLPSSAEVTSTTSSPDGPASVASVCHVLSINLDALTKIASSPNDPDVDHVIAQLRHLGDVAPAEIKNDLRVIADFDEKLVTDLRSGKPVDSIQETPALTSALAHEAKWIRANCI